jgi:hypothetical protein
LSCSVNSSSSHLSHARFVVGDERLDKWDDDEFTEQLKSNVFVTGDWVDVSFTLLSALCLPACSLILAFRPMS